MDDFKVLEKLSKRLIEYMKNDLGMMEIQEDISVQSVEEIQYNDISTVISLSGNIIGTISISVSNDLAKEMVKNFIYGDIDTKTLESLVSENVAETLNITLGNIIKDLSVIQNGGKIEISTPYTMHNRVSITKKKNGKMYLSNIQYKDENIILSYLI